MGSASRSLAPLYVAALVLVVFVAFGLHSASRCNGQWVFALDDSYIHLAMARNLAEHGVWGATPQSFSATSSAPIYTVMLAGVFLTGMGGEIWAWILSGLGGVVAAFLLTRRIGESIRSTVTTTVIGTACCIGIWLPETMATGMEHTLHISAVLMIVLLLDKVLAAEHSRPSSSWLAVIVFIAAGLRPETLFLLPPLCWILWRSDLRRLAGIVLAAGLLPAIVVGIVNSVNGALPLPNSVLLKGIDLEGGFLGHVTRLLRQLDEPARLALLIIAILQLLDISRREAANRLVQSVPSILYICAMVAHAALARPDRRYLGYLLALGLWAAIPALTRWFTLARETIDESAGSTRTALRALTLALVATLGISFTEQFLDLGRLPRLGQDIYAQQIQMARFLSTQFPNETVALNDIGATAWAGKNGILDLWGLADNEVARLRLSGNYGPAQMERLARERNVRVVAIYSHWFLRDKGLPEQWKLVGRWQIPGEIQVNSASNAVDFFAATPEAVEALRQKLQAFSSQLPENVRVIM